MCYRIFTKPENAHDWSLVSSHDSLAEAAQILDDLDLNRRGNRGKWVVRDTKGVLIARRTIASPPTACTFWTLSQVQMA